MTAPPILQRHPALRWLAPIGIACVAGLAATGFFDSSASPTTGSLPATTPAALIAAVRQPQVEGFSGTVVTHLSLGLPELPNGAGAGADSTSFTSLLSGAHTMHVWYGGASRQRVALLGSTEEADVFRDGRELWQWSSDDHSAVHAVLPSGSALSGPVGAVTDLTPLDLARRLLAAMESSTHVDIDRNHEVADRSAYDLVLTPHDAGTKIGQVRIAVDGQTKVPLGVQVLARGASSPSVDVTFSKITFGRQSARSFRFTPPRGAKVQQARPARRDATTGTAGDSAVTTRGAGWRSVLDFAPGTRTMAALRRSDLLSSLQPVNGSWGKGYLLDSDLVSALVTSDGRVLLGAVPPQALYAAAGRK